MKQGFIFLLAIILTTLTACEATDGQDIIVEMEVTRVVTVVVTPEGNSTDGDADAQSSGPLPVNSPQPTSESTVEATAAPTETATAGPTATPDVFPEPIVGEIFIAEQDFQNGKMFWLQPINQIWIATTNSEGEQIWINQDDEFEEGMPENDPALTPPATGLLQPVRGFGRIWRADTELQNMVGWATGEEFGYTTNYEYHWGGTVNENNEYAAGPGYHLIQTLNRTIYRFDEETRTWEIIRTAEEE